MDIPSFNRIISQCPTSTHSGLTTKSLAPDNKSKSKMEVFLLSSSALRIWGCFFWTVEENTDSACCRHTGPTATIAASLCQPDSGLGRFMEEKRERLRPIEMERGICCTLRGEVRGHCLILIKQARLIVFGNPVCHARYARVSLWHRLTYGPACCLPIQGPSTCSPRWTSSQSPVCQRSGASCSYSAIPPSPPTGFLLVFKPAWAIERSWIIQGGARERKGEKGLTRRERGGWMGEPDNHQRRERETLTDGGVGWGREI